MKPNFALDLSHDGIGLLHRGRKGWLRVGDVALDDPVMRGALAMLRRTAADLSPKGVSTKLILPPSQILYLEVEAPGPSDADRDAQIRAALEGRTPYEVSDLVYDHSGSGSTRQVALVARETLDEAEAFAVEHRFNPVSFVARPADGEYDGEPFFGQTRHARSLLKGETVEPDAEAVAVRGSVTLPEQPSSEPAAAAGAAPSGPDRDAAQASDAGRKQAQDGVSQAADVPDAASADDASDVRSDTDATTPRDAAPTRSPPSDPKGPSADTPGRDAPTAAVASGDSASFTTRRASGSLSGSMTPGARPTLGRAARFSMGAPALGAAGSASDDSEISDPADRAESKAGPKVDAPQLRADSPETSANRPAPEVAPLPDPPAPGPRAAHRGFSAKWSSGAPGEQAAAMQADPATSDHDAASNHGSGSRQTANAHVGGTGDPANPLPVPVATFPRRSGIMLTLLLLLALASIAVISTLMAQDDLVGVLTDPEPEASETVFLPPLGFDEPPLTAFRPTPRPVADRVAAQPDGASNPLLTQDPAGAGSDSPLSGATVANAEPVAGTGRPAASADAADRSARPADLVAADPDAVPSADTRTADAGGDLVDLTAQETPVVDLTDLAAVSTANQAAGAGPLGEDKVGRAAFSAPALGDLQPEDAAEVAEELLALVAPDESRRPARRPPPARRAGSDAEATDTPDPAIHYAATGVWTAAPPVPEAPKTAALTPPDAPRPALADPAVMQRDAVVLPDARASDDQRLTTRPVPADPSAEFALDARGLVRATPEGTLTPAGILVYAGRPDPAPLPRPGSADALAVTAADPAAPAKADATEAPVRTASTDGTGRKAEPLDAPEAKPVVGPVAGTAAKPAPASNGAPAAEPDKAVAAVDASPDAEPALTAGSIAVRSARRPEPRPEDLIARDAPQRVAGLTADDPAQSRTALRPEPASPSGQTPTGATAKPESTEFVPDDDPEPIEGATKLAVKSSGAPHGRPPEMASLIRKARATQMKNVATPDPNAAPRIPKNTSVAREATEKNLLDLSKISLIGVYGSSSNRRALVRLPSGRFTKVEVGDRMDGGRVVAIDDETLRYTKRGRNVVLSMPRG